VKALKLLCVVATLLLLGGCSEDGNNGPECEQECCLYTDCAEGQDCSNGCCRTARKCSSDATCQPEGLCIDGRCVGMCLNDTDCCEGNSCIYGFCEPYPQIVYDTLTSPAPDEDITQKTALKVGIGDVPLHFPVGVSMAGYGGRLGPRTPYRNTLGGSDSMLERPRVKAFVFDNGLKRLIIIKAPMSWSTDYMSSHVAWRIHQATGENYLNRMIFSAPHSHSHPGRYWNILKDKGIGVFGHGDFSYEIMWLHSEAIKEAVLAAINDLKPARFGYATMEPMDPDRVIHHYRRGEYPIVEMDDTLVVMRIDDDQGNPRAVLVNMALHGTHFDGTTVSQDAPGGVEVIAQQNFQEETGLPVKVAFISRCSGDVSPAGDSSGLDDWRKVQEVGVQAWPKIKQLFDQLEGQTKSDIDLDIANIRVPVNREMLGYGPEEFYDVIGETPCEKDRDCAGGMECIKGLCSDVYHFGGFQCVMSGDEDPATKHEDGKLGCIFSAAVLADYRPIPQFAKSRLSVAHIADLGIITIPGEPLSQYGRDLAEHMVDRGGVADATIFGFSQDHHFYLMHADNWWQGGYEPSMDIWGWREADYYWEKSAEMIDQFTQSGGFTEDNQMLPTWFNIQCESDADCEEDPRGNPMICDEQKYCKVAPTPTTGAGTVVSDVPATIERISLASLSFTGGHPGVDLPRMTLEKDDGGGFVTATNAAGEVYSDDGFSTILFYRGDYQTDHTWEVRWEETCDFPTGRYRIRISGHYFDGSATQSYTLTSQAFDFVASSRLIVSGLALTNDRVSGVAWYPNGPTNDDGASPFEELQPTGVLRHTGSVPPTMPWVLPTDGTATVDITIQPPAGAAVQINDVPINQTGTANYTYVSSRLAGGQESTDTRSLPSSGFDAAHGAYSGAGTYSVTVTATDALGNSGTASADLQLN